jgi:hypothetical protein
LRIQNKPANNKDDGGIRTARSDCVVCRTLNDLQRTNLQSLREQLQPNLPSKKTLLCYTHPRSECSNATIPIMHPISLNTSSLVWCTTANHNGSARERVYASRATLNTNIKIAQLSWAKIKCMKERGA